MATPEQIKAVLHGFPHDLKWTNFRSVDPSPSPPHQAQTATSLSMRWSGVALKRGLYQFKGLRIDVSVNGPSTWAVSAARTNPVLLRHEQGHYDITGLIARDLANNLLDVSLDAGVVASLLEAGKTVAEHMRYVQGRFQQSFDDYSREANALLAKLQTNPQTHADGIYDTQTQHGLNQAAQTVWDDRFAQLKRSNASFALALALAGVR